MNLKQLFCRHIWRNEKMEYLRRTREQFGYDGRWNMPTYANFAYYAQTQCCVKCPKSRVIEKRLIIA